METQLIIGPLVGAIIGLITNGIAIKMIFRPLYAKYLWGWKLPFTPGLIPKENSYSCTIGSLPFHLGDRIRITEGKLQGLESYIIHCIERASYIVIRLDCLGCAKMRIKNENAEIIV